MKVSLAPSFRPVKAEGTQIAGAPLLEEGGPRVVLRNVAQRPRCIGPYP